MRHWALVVAAGTGRRMQAAIPKQYLPLAGRTVLEHSLECFAGHRLIDGIMLVLAAADAHWADLGYRCSKPLRTTAGGQERAASVLLGLQALAAQPDDWVLVHDAARPCLQRSELDSLFAGLADDPCGGLLALPVRDTVKRATGGQVSETLDRGSLWLAQTPQMFRAGLLQDALQQAEQQSIAVTDEAMAMELCGHRPRLIAGRPSNIKITTAADLPMADWILRQQDREG